MSGSAHSLTTATERVSTLQGSALQGGMPAQGKPTDYMGEHMPTLTWDEPQAATTPRGWLHNEQHCIGFYLDYGPDNHRIEHASMTRVMNEMRLVTWCKPDRQCRECQPGNILAVRYPDGPHTAKSSRYVETVEQARAYVETGTV